MVTLPVLGYTEEKASFFGRVRVRVYDSRYWLGLGLGEGFECEISAQSSCKRYVT